MTLCGKLFFRSVNVRGVIPFRNRSDDLNHVGYLIRVFDNHFARRVLAEVRKFLEHFLRCTEIQA